MPREAPVTTYEGIGMLDTVVGTIDWRILFSPIVTRVRRNRVAGGGSDGPYMPSLQLRIARPRFCCLQNTIAGDAQLLHLVSGLLSKRACPHFQAANDEARRLLTHRTFLPSWLALGKCPRQIALLRLPKQGGTER